MRILLVNTFHFRGGGDSTYTFNLAELLRSKGHEVAFFAMQDARNLPDPNADLFIRSIDFRQLNQKKNLALSFRVPFRAIYSTEARRNFAKLLGRFNPDIVHLQSIHGHITPSIIFEAREKGIPVVWTLHDYRLICPNSTFLNDFSGEICEACRSRDYYQAALKRCKKGSLLASCVATLEAYVHSSLGIRDRVDRFLSPSAFLRKKLIECGFQEKKVVQVPLFLPSEIFDHHLENRGYFLFMGRVERRKGIQVLLEACRLAPEISMVIAGRVDDELAVQLLQKLPPNAEYVGSQYGDDLRTLVRGAIAVVLPSIWYENQPFSLLEAFASSKPAIVSDLGGLIELVTDGERGSIVKKGDARSLADAMKWMFHHPDETRFMSENAWNFAQKHCQQDVHYRKLSELYNGVINGSM